MYAVKVIATATEKNANFAGVVNEYLYGKDQTLIGYKDKYLGGEREPYPLMVRDYGYHSENSAKRSYIYRHSEDTEFWHKEVSIVEV